MDTETELRHRQVTGPISDAQRQDEAVLQHFRYHPLPPGDMIRVIDLSETTSRLECKISQIPLSQAKYVALSYVWGSPDTPFQIVMIDEENGSSGYVAVTANLHSLLKDIRSTTGIGIKQFWIDQITINQADEQEKGQQVNLMRKIYRYASQVITYIGPHSPNMEEESQALSLLSRLDAHFRPNYAYLEAQPNAFINTSDHFPVPRLPSSIPTDDPAWPTLLRIVCGEWTKRLWMVQENILCDDTVMLRGHQLLNWLSVASIPFLFYAGILPDILLSQLRSELAFDPSVNIDRLLPTWERRLECSNGQQAASTLRNLVGNLSFYNELQCRDQRDKVFALLGISSDAEELGIESDYKNPVEEVLLRISIQIYQHSREMELLEVISEQADQLTSSLPSWVYLGTQNVEYPIPDYYPHPDSHTDVRFEADNRTMIVRGRITNKIRFITQAVDIMERIPDHNNKIRVCEQRALAITELLNQTQYGLDELDQLAQVWVADPDWSSGDYDAYSGFCTWALYRYAVIVWRNWNNSISNDSALSVLLHHTTHKLRAALGKARENIATDPWESLTPEEFEVGGELWNKGRVQGRSMGILESGYLCNVSGRAQCGDVVALLQGGKQAYVLRPVHDRFRFVGTISICEYANGAAYAGVDKDSVDQDIAIV